MTKEQTEEQESVERTSISIAEPTRDAAKAIKPAVMKHLGHRSMSLSQLVTWLVDFGIEAFKCTEVVPARKRGEK